MTVRTTPVRGADDSALDDALEHIGTLAERLWAVRRLHTPGPAPRRARALLRVRACPAVPTLQAAAAA